jgi:hypothetical protein
MLSDTWRGMAAQRRSFRSAGFNLRQFATVSCQVINEYYTNQQQRKESNWPYPVIVAEIVSLQGPGSPRVFTQRNK